MVTKHKPREAILQYRDLQLLESIMVAPKTTLDLARILKLTPKGVWDVLNKLEARKLVERKPSLRGRIIWIKPTVLTATAIVVLKILDNKTAGMEILKDKVIFRGDMSKIAPNVLNYMNSIEEGKIPDFSEGWLEYSYSTGEK